MLWYLFVCISATRSRSVCLFVHLWFQLFVKVLNRSDEFMLEGQD